MDSDGTSNGPELVIACCGLAAELMRDVVAVQHSRRGVTAQTMQQLVLSLCTLAPLLCDLAARVAASGPSSPSAAPGGDAFASSYCWQTTGWADMLHLWALSAMSVRNLTHIHTHCTDHGSYLAAAAAAQALLRMLPLLPQQLVFVDGGPPAIPAAEAVEAAGGAAAVDHRFESTRQWTPEGPAVMLSSAHLHLAARLLMPTSGPGGAGDLETATAAFHALSTACRAAHSLSAALRANGQAEGEAAAAAAPAAAAAGAEGPSLLTGTGATNTVVDTQQLLEAAMWGALIQYGAAYEGHPAAAEAEKLDR